MRERNYSGMGAGMAEPLLQPKACEAPADTGGLAERMAALVQGHEATSRARPKDTPIHWGAFD